MKVRKKVLAGLLCALVVCLMVFGTLSTAFAAAVPAGNIADQATGAVPTDDGGAAIPILGDLPILGDVLNTVAEPLAPVLDTVTGLLGGGADLGVIPSADTGLPIPGLDALALPGLSGGNPLQPLLDLLDPSNLPGLPGIGGGGDSGLVSVLSPILGPLHDGLEMLRDPLTQGLAPLYEALKPIEEPLRQGLAPVKDIVQDVVTTLDPVLFPVLHALSPVLCPVLEVLEPVIAELAKVCPGILPPCPEPEEPETPVTPGGNPTTPTTPVTPSGGTTPTGGTTGGVLPFTGANLTAMIVLLMALTGVVIALRRAHLVLKARER